MRYYIPIFQKNITSDYVRRDSGVKVFMVAYGIRTYKYSIGSFSNGMDMSTCVYHPMRWNDRPGVAKNSIFSCFSTNIIFR